jgi:hypothetical protein
VLSVRVQALRLDRRTIQRLSLRAARGIHGLRNDADEPTSILMLFAPGAPREAYFEGFANWPTSPTRSAPSGSSRTTTSSLSDTR